MKNLRLIKVNLSKVLTCVGFYACVLLTLILCFTAQAYQDVFENKNYSVIGVLSEFTREEMLTDSQFSAYQILSCISSGWLSMFIPIVAAFPLMPLICDERESKSMRYSAFRSTKFSFSTGNFLTAMISGGLAVLCGFVLFAVMVYMLFPNINEYPPELIESAEWWISGTYPLFEKYGYPYMIALDFLEMFLYGALSATPALIMTAFMKNKYLVLCIPFFLKYSAMQLHTGLLRNAYQDIENINENYLEILSVIEPDAIGNIFFYGETMWRNWLFNAVLLFLAFVLYTVMMNRRVDFGE
ncbi:MAG: hypothetical protein IKI94_12060 [Ruminococcus sp.]|nr:hypothetical protein [Ruminococcus sp.]